MCGSPHFLGGLRNLLLEVSSNDVQRYAQIDEKNSEGILLCRQKQRPSELNWLRSGWWNCSHNLDQFLAEYGLAGPTEWDTDSLGSSVGKWKAPSAGSCLPAVVSERSDDIAQHSKRRKAMGNNKHAVVAATKLSFFMNPCSRFFISDRHARRGAFNRCCHNFHKKQYNVKDIGPFYEDMNCILRYEIGQPDFQNYICQCIRTYQSMLDEHEINLDEACLRDFITRRLLDKLIFYEGKILGRLFAMKNVVDEDLKYSKTHTTTNAAPTRLPSPASTL